MGYLDLHGLGTFFTKLKTTFGGSLDKSTDSSKIRIQLKDKATTPNVLGYTDIQKNDITGLGIPAQDTTYVFNTPYNATSNKAATMTDVQNAIVTPYKGTIASEAQFVALTNYKAGDYWIASTTFTHTLADTTTITIDTGNMIIAKNNFSSTYSASDFDIIQADIEAIPDSEINALS